MLAPTMFPGRQEGSLGEGWKGVKEKAPKNVALSFLGFSFTHCRFALSVGGSCSSSQTSQVLFQTCG